MPVLESTDHVTPRSALRHRPIELTEKEGKGKKSTAASGITPVAQRASRIRQKQTEEKDQEQEQAPNRDKDQEKETRDVVEWKRTGEAEADGKDIGKRARASSAQPATSTGPKKLPKTPLPGPTGKKARRFSIRAHPLVFLGIGMIFMLALWTLLTFTVSWWNTTWNDIQYGRPRTFQIDAVVGQNDSAANPSHFIAINLKGRIEVIEFPGGDASKARIYIGPQLYGNDDDLIPITLSFVDVQGNHQPDMIIHFQDTRIVYVNTQGGFRPANASELQSVERYLQKHGQ